MVVHDWQSGMLTKFKDERKRNPKRHGRSPESVQDVSDISFHKNLIVVEDWVSRLKEGDESQQLNKVLTVATGMIAPKPKNRLLICGKSNDKLIPDLEGDLCVRPPFKGWPNPIDSRGMSFNLQPDMEENMESSLHRAIRTTRQERCNFGVLAGLSITRSRRRDTKRHHEKG